MALRRRDKRTLGDLVGADDETLSGTQLPADPLVPIGFERHDSAASLSMLAGNVAVQLARRRRSSRLISSSIATESPISGHAAAH